MTKIVNVIPGHRQNFAEALSYVLTLIIGVSVIWIYKDTVERFINSQLKYQTLESVMIGTIAFYLIWEKRHDVFKERSTPEITSGVLWLTCGCIFYAFGSLSDTLILTDLSLIVVVQGLILLFYGRRILKSVLPGVTFLVFIFPVGELGLSEFVGSLQQIGANIGRVIISAVGIPVFLEGNLIELPGRTLEVARACSGINHIMALIAIAWFLTVRLNCKGYVKLLIVIMSPVVGIILNGLRIGIIGVFSFFYQGQDIHGPFNIFYTTFVLVVGVIILLAGRQIAKFVWCKSVPEKPQKDMPTQRRSESSGRLKMLARLAAIVLISGTCLWVYSVKLSAAGLNKSMEDFSLNLSSWQGKNIHFEGWPFDNLVATDKLKRLYVNTQGDRVRVFVSYIDIQRQDIEVVNYLSERLHDQAQHAVLGKGDIKVGVNRVRLTSDNERKDIYFWYQIGNYVVANRLLAKIAQFYNAIFYGRKDGAIVVIYKESDGEKQGGSENVVGLFLQSFMPKWKAFMAEI